MGFIYATSNLGDSLAPLAKLTSEPSRSNKFECIYTASMDLDKAPFFVTLAVAVAGWSATYVVGRITGSPTLEYEPGQSVSAPLPSEPKAKSQTVRLTNLTRSTTFKSLTVVLMAPRETRILDEATEIVAVPPAFEGNDPWKYRGGMARYVIPRVHPGWTYLVRVGYVGDRPPVLRFESEESIYATRPNWETFVVRHEVWILLAIGGLWSLFVFAYLVQNVHAYIAQGRSKRPTASSATSTLESDDETG
jgi:hypothetical protein